MNAPISGILLAAGAATRFGANKLLHPLDDDTPLALAAARRLATVLPDTLAVVGDAHHEVAGLFAAAGVATVTNPHAADGMGGSIASAVRARAQSRGWVIALADMPWIEPASIARVVAALDAGAGIVAPRCNGRRGHPVGFSAAFFEALSSLSGDQGARGLLRAHQEALLLVDVDDPGIHVDIDRPADLHLAVNNLRGP